MGKVEKVMDKVEKGDQNMILWENDGETCSIIVDMMT